ncbi:MAG: prolipoprotein diacylglyceryl transferase [Chrysiogenetes bacterium]|nr:prolipoprotein diacylglyceryl transferase [Chrysiogenetes bacterium]
MVWHIDPILFDLGPIQIRYYGICFATGLLLGLQTAKQAWSWRDGDPEEIDSMFLWLVLGVVVGSHWVHMIFYETRHLLDNPFQLLNPLTYGQGLASHGGAAGVITAVYLVARKRGRSFFAYADVLSIGGMWMVVMVRLGNFFNSEIVGRPTDMPWGVIFANHQENFARHPSQLYESFHGVLCLVFTYWFYKRYHKKLPEGSQLLITLVLYFGGRFLLEYFKAYQALSESFPFTMGQLLSAPIVIVGAWALFGTKRFGIRPALSATAE